MKKYLSLLATGVLVASVSPTVNLFLNNNITKNDDVNTKERISKNPFINKISGLNENNIIFSIKNDKDGTIWVQEYEELYKSTDNGLNFQKVDGIEGDVETIQILDNGSIWVGTKNQGLYKSTDNGLNFQKVEKFGNDLIWSIGISDNNTIFIGESDSNSQANNLYRSTDNGVNFIKIPSINDYVEEIKTDKNGAVR